MPLETMQVASTNKVDVGRPEAIGVPFAMRGGRGDQQRRAVPLSEYFDQNRQPSLAGVVGRASTGGPEDELLNDGDDELRPRRKLYVHWRSTTTNVVIAESLRLDMVDGGTNGRRPSGSRLTPSGRLHSIPADHGGWYELLSADGHSTAPITTVGRLVDLGVEKFLVQQAITATDGSAAAIVQLENNYSVPRKVRQIAVGETLTFAIAADDRRNGKRRTGSTSSSTTQKVQSTGRVSCIVDQTGDKIELSVDQCGVFLPVAGESAVTGVHRLHEVVRKFRLPVVVRLAWCNSGNRGGGSRAGSDISTGSILRLMSADVEPAVHIVPLPSTVPLPSSSFDVVYVVPKRACVFVDQVPLSDDCSERQRGRPPPHRSDLERLTPVVVDELCRRCEQLISGSRTTSVVCRVLPVAASTAVNAKNADEERRFDSAKPDIFSADVQNTSLGRQPSVDSGTSSLTGGGQQTSTTAATDAGFADTPSTNDTAEIRLMDEIDIIYDAIRGFGVESPPRGRPLFPAQRSASYCFRSRHQSVERPKNAADQRPTAPGAGGDTTAYRRQTPPTTATGKAATPVTTARQRQLGNTPQRSMTLDANFVIASPRRTTMRSTSQPPRLERQLTVAPVPKPTAGPLPPRTTADNRGNRSPAASRARDGNTAGFNRLLIGFESSDFEDNVTPDQYLQQCHQMENGRKSENIYDCVTTETEAKDASPKRVVDGAIQHRDVEEMNKTKLPTSTGHRRTARPQSYAGTATAFLTDITAALTTMTMTGDGELQQLHPQQHHHHQQQQQQQQQHLKRYPSESRRVGAAPPLPPGRHPSPALRPRSAGTPPTSGREHSGNYVETPSSPMLPLKSSSTSSFGGALGALSRSFFSTVRRVGGTRTANGKTLVLNQTGRRPNGVAGDNYGLDVTATKFDRHERSDDAAVAGNKSKMWWNADELRGQRDRLTRDFSVDPAVNNAFMTMPSGGGTRKRFSYTEPASREYSVRLFVKRF